MPAAACVVDLSCQCTVLVAPGVERTSKTLACVARGVPVVSRQWLHAAEEAAKRCPAVPGGLPVVPPSAVPGEFPLVHASAVSGQRF